MTAISAELRASLAGRGLDGLLREYDERRVKADPGDQARCRRLERFFQHCTPADPQDGVRRLPVRLAYRQDLDHLLRTTRLIDASQETAMVEGKVLPDAPVHLIDLKDALILPDQTVLVDGFLVVEQVRHMSGRWLESGEGYDMERLSNLDPRARTLDMPAPGATVALPDTTTYFLFQSLIGSASFGHFLHDAMIQLIAFDHLRTSLAGGLTPIIVNDLDAPLRYPGMRWLYEGLVGPVKDCVHVAPGAAVRVRRGFTTNRLMHIGDGGIAFEAVRYLRRRIFEAFQPSAARQVRRRVYISRRDVKNREGSNMAEVEALLADHGFSEVVIGGMAPQDVFDALYDAEVVIGMHGSGLMNYVYSRGPAKVIEMAHEGYLWDSILSFAAACGHAPFRVPHRAGGVDMDALRSILAEL